MNRLRTALVAALTAVSFVACSDAPKEVAFPKEPEKPPEAVTGRKAFYSMYPMARMWASDIQGLRLSSIRLDKFKVQEGKSGAWEATFVSPSRSKQRSYTYSVIEAGGNLHKGTFEGFEESYSPTSGSAGPWPIQAFKIDSDQAWKTAAAKSTAYMAKFPGKPMFFLLEMTSRAPNLVWRVVWADSVSTSDYSVYIDAVTGDFLEKMR
jgi:hypothetical protein